jgi:hypothetical protein
MWIISEKVKTFISNVGIQKKKLKDWNSFNISIEKVKPMLNLTEIKTIIFIMRNYQIYLNLLIFRADFIFCK